ncbi:hypothetical protein, partial [Delftia acidovorans]|uniref:hypothetical protein n=1 Tax=Delftia acidovorans TaxID=80866 RepID=UPI0035A0821F
MSYKNLCRAQHPIQQARPAVGARKLGGTARATGMATVAVRQIAKSGRQTSHQAPENPRQHERPQSSRSAIGHANIPS